MAHPDGMVQGRDRGTPQGSAVSPVLANLFLHYAFGAWMSREFPTVPFERYVDDVVVHAATHGEAEWLRSAIAARMVEVGLELHPEKTEIGYRKDDNRRRQHGVVEIGAVGAEPHRGPLRGLVPRLPMRAGLGD